MLFVNNQISIPRSELEFDFVRSSGPGGQNVNKVNTKAVMRWDVGKSPSLPEDVRKRFEKRFARRINKEGYFLMTSQRFRDRGRNVADCLSKLRELLLVAAKPPTVRKKTKPSKSSVQRRRRQKQMNSDKKSNRRKHGWGE